MKTKTKHKQNKVSYRTWPWKLIITFVCRNHGPDMTAGRLESVKRAPLH